MLHIFSLLICCYNQKFLLAPELFTYCTDVNTCVRANWYMSNVLCDIHQWFRCLCSSFIIIYVKHSNGTFCQDSSAVSGAFLFARAAKWSSCLFTCSWEHGCNDPPPAHYQTYRWCEFWFIANHRWVTPRSYINKKQNVITWLQIFMLHLGGEGDWKHLCKLSWNILLSFQGGGGEIFFFLPFRL